MSDAVTFDPAAFRAALQSAIAAAVTPVTLPGIGAAFRRDVTVADVHEAADIAAEHAKTLALTPKQISVGVGLAQALCGPDGVRIFDPYNGEHVEQLSRMPWSAARPLTKTSGGDDEKND